MIDWYAWAIFGFGIFVGFMIGAIWGHFRVT
jgi:hypothetical protein